MTETPFGVLIGQLAQAAPTRPAVTCDEVTISRAELERGRTGWPAPTGRSA